MTLKYQGVSERRGLKDGMYINVPTKWATDSLGRVTADAIQQIMEALKEEWITIDDYDYVFSTDNCLGGLINTPLRAGWRGRKVLNHWREV